MFGPEGGEGTDRGYSGDIDRLPQVCFTRRAEGETAPETHSLRRYPDSPPPALVRCEQRRLPLAHRRAHSFPGAAHRAERR